MLSLCLIILSIALCWAVWHRISIWEQIKKWSPWPMKLSNNVSLQFVRLSFMISSKRKAIGWNISSTLFVDESYFLLAPSPAHARPCYSDVYLRCSWWCFSLGTGNGSHMEMAFRSVGGIWWVVSDALNKFSWRVKHYRLWRRKVPIRDGWPWNSHLTPNF